MNILRKLSNKWRNSKMNINLVNNTNVKVTVNKSEDGTFSILIFDDNTKNDKPLGAIDPGKIIKIGNREWVVLGHGSDTTAIISKDFVAEKEFDSKSNDYAKSDIRKWLNDVIYKELKEAVGAENVVEHTVNLTADDGTGKGAKVKDKVSLLTTELYRRYREYLPAYGNWWWTATPASKEEGYSRSVCCVYGDGSLYCHGCDWSYGVRPFCILSSSVLNFEKV